jgi:type 1 fimbria pilin
VDASYDGNSRNVQIQVRDKVSDSPLVIGNATTSATSPATIAANGSASIPLRAFYYAKNGSAVADGLLTAQATYVLRTN